MKPTIFLGLKINQKLDKFLRDRANKETGGNIGAFVRRSLADLAGDPDLATVPPPHRPKKNTILV